MGGGASGTLVAAHLLMNAFYPIRVVIFEPRPETGTGLAYGTLDPAHLLNVPAGRMSALPEQPAHFLKWLNSTPEGKDFGAGDFVPRMIYARYLNAMLDEAIAKGAKVGALFEHRRERVVDFIPGEEGGTAVTESADTVDVTHVVLGLGNLPPRDPLSRAHPFFQSPRYVRNVWHADAWQGLSPDESVLIAGSGLTAVDLISTLARRNHAGKIYVTSRNGRLPAWHEVHAPYPDFLKERPFPATARGWLRLLREEIARAAKAGVDWRPVLDSLRPHSQHIWAGLNTEERRKFLRHLRSFWECHRHRIPPATWETLSRLRSSGQVVFLPGRIRDFAEHEDGVTVELQRKGTREMVSLDVARVLNCIGPESNFAYHLNHPLIVNLIARGVLHPDELYLGLRATSDGQMIGAEERIFRQVSTLGPPLRGLLWETTAIPEIRVQAQRLARRILDMFHLPSWQI